MSAKPIFLDGGTGTILQARGLPPGISPETWNIAHPEEIQRVHAAYAAAGANIVCANTFGANRVKYHGEYPLEEVIPAAIRLARSAVGDHGRVALDIGPTGRLLAPAGDFAFDAAYACFAEQVRLGAAAGADLVLIETMGDTYELKAAVLAAKENCTLPVFATVALGENGKLLTGGDVACVAALLEGLRVDALGFNCGLGPDRMLPFVRALAQETARPIIVKPNAGLPHIVAGKTVFPVGPEEFAQHMAQLVAAGASIIGGCCGTTPDHIAALTHYNYPPFDLDSKLRLSPLSRRRPCVVSSGTHAVTIPFDDALIVGERINPTGKKLLKAALTAGDVAYVLREAVTQVEAGAQILDVNVGVPGLDEATLLPATVQRVQGVVDVPIQIDTANAQALQAALRYVNGKPLVNSVSGKRESLEAVLPLVAKYGGVVVALTLDENGIPPTAEGRVAIARKILAEGAKYGLTPDDFVIDVLCLAVSAEPASARVILGALRRVRQELGCRTILGVSNISFGLPERAALNAAFFTLALEAGLSVGIVNPLATGMMQAYRAWRALTGRDANCAAWIAHAPTSGAAPSPAHLTHNNDPLSSANSPLSSINYSLSSAIRRGLKEDAAHAAQRALAADCPALELINAAIVPALDAVGKGFEAGTLFLPQLLMAAEAAAAAFAVVRASLPASTVHAEEKGPIVFATVKGDIHDIGKNICCSLLTNYGFKVIDLGRDVDPVQIVQAVKRNAAPLVGLSALMTTTVGAMEETIRLLKAEAPACKIIVGGAVLTADYAQQIGAHAYSHDAMEMVTRCNDLLMSQSLG